MKYQKLLFVFIFTLFFNSELYSQNRKNMEIATFGSGCFWCTEAIFQQLIGVESATSGYSGGEVKNPTYNEVCSGQTGHAEVIQVKFNSELLSFTDLLEVFWQTHDPTTLNQQGTDVGTQYRSVIFYHSNDQKELAETFKQKLDKAEIYDNPIITEISEFEAFYKAEDYHQEYYNNNKTQSYCNFVITPKLDKFKKIFKDKLN
ncbi:MAG: peptide-methionine (S)-S-oxide reductase MsrA [Bacteroidales bacterium]|nr:peptide-methionine (S)-S-oxide reductase MsrA [Bacteroidales bacterium]